jgi:hypothetical protein
VLHQAAKKLRDGDGVSPIQQNAFPAQSRDAQLQWQAIRATMRALLTGRPAGAMSRRSTAFSNIRDAGA